uniref:Transmembrane protein 132E n=1 Tax=Rousettus aegyptiacus TaxID=9407 RepID=A0A7J8GHI0_ROUAE|nr:transmembrane protein 132E [Rousettus aegyptiacus]
MNARVTFRYDVLTAPLEMTVWVPKLPLHIELSDTRLSQVKGWRVPILPDRRSARESEDEDEEEEERRQSPSRGCTLQYQHATLQVFTQFHTTSSEGTDQVVTMLGPDWLVEVTDLVSDFMRVGDPRVARMVDSSTLAGLEPGTTPFKVVSPLTESVLGETLLTVTEEKVSITQLQAQVVASLALSLRPSPGSSHTILATTAAQQTLSFLKQEALLSLWLSYSDGTTAPLSLYSPRDYGLLVSSLDERVATVTQDRAFPLVIAEAEGAGELIRAELTISESCQKTKRKSVLATTPVGLRVHFGREEEDPTYDYPGPRHCQPSHAAYRRFPATAHGLPADAPGADRPGDWHVRTAGRLLPRYSCLPHQLHRLRAAVSAQAHPARGPDQHGPLSPLGVPGQRAASAGAGGAVSACWQPTGDRARLLPRRPPQQRQLADQCPEPGTRAG